MQRFLTILVGIVTLAATPAAGETTNPVIESFRLSDTGALATVCSVPEGSELYTRANAFCLGYMSGAMHFYAAAEKSPKVKPFVCPPGEVSRAHMREVFLAWAKQHPDRLSEPAIDGLIRAAVAQYPCKK